MRRSPIRVALLGDVHGNLPALETVLGDVQRRGAAAVWHLGDFVGYGPYPEAVVQRIQDTPDLVTIAGNYDQRIVKFPMRSEKWRRTKAANKFFALSWAYAHLSEGSKEYLASLPITRHIQVGAKSVLLTHGSPESVDEPLTPDTPDARFEELAAMAGADMVACGHTHRPFLRRVGDTLFVNPGSCGRPEGGDPRSCYALLDFSKDGIDVSLERIGYDVGSVVVEMGRLGFPGSFARMLTLGRNLEEVGAETSKMNDTERIEAILDLARICDYEAGHTHQVTRLALLIFDELKALHGLKKADRFLLECGCLLHDIGWCEGRQAHHKTARRIILNAAGLPLDERERQITALIARYHRKSLPREDHAGFRDLSAGDQWRVRVLAGFLRVADGLDRSHQSVVQDVQCDAGKKQVTVTCTAESGAALEARGASQKADLVESVFGRVWKFEMRKPERAGSK